MSLLETLFTCAFALCCNLLFQFLPAVPCPSPISQGPRLCPQGSPQVCPCLWCCHPTPECSVWVSVWGKLPGYWLGFSCPWQRWTVLSLLWQDVTRSLFSTRMTGLAGAEQGGATSTECLRESPSSGTHRVTAANTGLCPLPGKHCFQSWGQAASQTYKQNMGKQGHSASELPGAQAATGDTQHCSPVVPMAS